MKDSIKFQLNLALAIQFLLLSAIVAFTLYTLELRKHDYTILNLAGQLRVVSQTMMTQSRNYVENAPRDYETYDRDLRLFSKDLNTLVKSYDGIMKSFMTRELSPELWRSSIMPMQNIEGSEDMPEMPVDDDVKYGKWDASSKYQLEETLRDWC